MLWELFDDVRRYARLTLIPAMKNLFASKRSFVGMLLVMFILQLLLSVVCIFGIENVKIQQSVLEGFEASLSSATDIVGDASSQAASQNGIATTASSTSVFIGALILWAICAVTVYQKVTFAAADRDKYLWGMYVTHGSKKKKIRAMLKAELYLPHLIATAVAYPTALILCNRTMNSSGISYGRSIITLPVILLLSYLCIRLVVAYQGFVIRSMSCMDMLRVEDAPKSISYPRKLSRLVRGFTPFRYGACAFCRMRKYYISLAVITAIPAVIWVCFQVSATSQDSYLSDDINEFSISVASGIDEDEFKGIRDGELLKIDGVTGVSSSARYDASKIYTHVLADKQSFSTVTNSPFFTTTYADNTIRLCVPNRAFKQYTGYNAPTVSKGKVNILSTSGSPYSFKEEDTIFLAISKLDGSVRAVSSLAELMSTDIKERWDYIELEVGSVKKLPEQELEAELFRYMTGTYFLLNEEDYNLVTSLSADDCQSTVVLNDYSYTSNMNSKGEIIVTVKASALKKLPQAGDCIDIDGRYTASISVSDPSITGEGKTNSWTQYLQYEKFDYMYINSVSVSGDSVTLTVTPYDIVVMEEDDTSFGKYPTVVLALGVPQMDYMQNKYCITSDGITTNVSGGTVKLESNAMKIYTSTVVSAAECGTHTILAEKNVKDSSKMLKLEDLHADNGFDIVCGDGTTADLSGYELPLPQKGDAILFLPTNSANYWSFKVGDKLLLATTFEDVVNYDPSSTVQGGSYDLLDEHVNKLDYSYTAVYVTEVIYSDDIERPCVFVCGDDFKTVIAKDAPYNTISVSISSDIDNEQYAEIRESLSDWVRDKAYPVTVYSNGNYLTHLLRTSANYEVIMRLIGLIIPLIIPFIWYYPLATLFDRRKSEIRVLEAIGKKRRTIGACLLFEGAAVTLCAFLAVILLCLPTTFVFKTVCVLCELPLEFEYRFLSLPVLLTAGALSAVCAAICFCICCATTSSGRIKKRSRSNYGNS